jgi:hypothetical protein
MKERKKTKCMHRVYNTTAFKIGKWAVIAGF